MKGHFYIFMMLLLSALLAGCSDKKKAPDFDRRSSALMLDACEAIIKNDEKSAIKVLEALSRQTDGSSFVEEMQLAVKRHHDTLEIEDILDSGDFQKLKLFLRKAEGEGQLSTGNIIAADMPDALQALMLYRAKMPWEDSVSMQMALTALSPYYETLSHSQVFRDFHAKQLSQLKAMRDREISAKVSGCISSLETAAVNGDSSAWAYFREELRRIQPSSPLFKYERMLGRRVKVPANEARYHAISLLGNWERLGRQQRAASVADVHRGGGICAGTLNAISTGTLEALESHVQEMKLLGLPPSPLAAEHFANSLFSKKTAKGNRTNPPVMGLYGIFDFLSSTEITVKTGNRK